MVSLLLPPFQLFGDGGPVGGDLRANSVDINPRENPLEGLASWPRTFISQTGAFSSWLLPS